MCSDADLRELSATAATGGVSATAAESTGETPRTSTAENKVNGGMRLSHRGGLGKPRRLKLRPGFAGTAASRVRPAARRAAIGPSRTGLRRHGARTHPSFGDQPRVLAAEAAQD